MVNFEKKFQYFFTELMVSPYSLLGVIVLLGLGKFSLENEPGKVPGKLTNVLGIFLVLFSF